jgi:hypothetical protein
MCCNHNSQRNIKIIKLFFPLVHEPASINCRYLRFALSLSLSHHLEALSLVHSLSFSLSQNCGKISSSAKKLSSSRWIWKSVIISTLECIIRCGSRRNLWIFGHFSLTFWLLLLKVNFYCHLQPSPTTIFNSLFISHPKRQQQH